MAKHFSPNCKKSKLSVRDFCSDFVRKDVIELFVREGGFILGGSTGPVRLLTWDTEAVGLFPGT